ncbi:MAG: HAMP domain-containing sensor histidine kinase [Chloroflexota bacterium]
MNVVKTLQDLRSIWLDRVSIQLSSGEEEWVDIRQQIAEFYDHVIACVSGADYAPLDPLLEGWASACTQSESDTTTISLMPLLSQMMLTTLDCIDEHFDVSTALMVSREILAVFVHMLNFSTQAEIQCKLRRSSERLEQAMKELAHIDRSKSNFISIAAHELKTPLTLIEGYTGMLRELHDKQDESSPSILMIKGIRNGITRLNEIVEDMIDISLIDNDLLSLNYQPVWLNHIFEALELELRDIVEERHQQLTIHPFPGANRMTYGDPERLCQAFRNVLNNAIKFTPNHGSITVDGRELPGFIEVIIADTGIGIDEQDQTRIFYKFGKLGDVSLHSSSKTHYKGGGPGLGLPISKGIIEAHGGTIWVESPGCDEQQCPGSTFHILLPKRSEPPEAKTIDLFSTGR